MQNRTYFRLKLICLTAALGLGATCLLAQEPKQAVQAPIAFEVASVKAAATPDPQPMFCLVPCSPGERLTVEGSRVDIRFMSLSKLIVAAYRIKPYQLTGPDWMRTERFDIAAKLPDGVSKDKVPEMLQALLAERFKLTIHRDNKDLPVYALVVSKSGLKLKEPAADADAPVPEKPGDRTLYSSQGDARVDEKGNLSVTGGPLGPIRSGRGPDGGMRIDLSKINMPALAELVAPHVDRPVVDMTELSGAYQFSWEMPAPSGGDGGRRGPRSATPGDSPNADAPPARSPFDEVVLKAVDKAGLKLEARKAPVEMIVVDHLEKMPTGN